MNFSARLRKMCACSRAIKWTRQFKSAQAAWDASERPDWMLWYAAKVCGPQGSASHRKLVLVACACARTGLRFVAKGEKRPETAIVLAERWANHDPMVSMADVSVAIKAAGAAAVGKTSDAAYAADAAAHAACAIYLSGTTAPYAAWRGAMLRTATLVRKHYPKPPSRRVAQ